MIQLFNALLKLKGVAGGERVVMPLAGGEGVTQLMCVLVAELCLTLPPQGLWPARLLYPWDFPGKNTGVSYHILRQGIFLTQVSNPRLLHCRRILYHLSHQGRNKAIWRAANSDRGSQAGFPETGMPSRVLQDWLELSSPCQASRHIHMSLRTRGASMY